ncbi:MAG: DUF1232 domain-containing protein [Oscillospiraceae bacterium]|nr:DUF1232 domain-containing protein [Oscillospiraceae bacterium]
MKKHEKTASLGSLRKWLYEKQLVKAEKIVASKKKVSKVIKKARKIFERLHNLPRCKALSENICNFCDLLSDYFDGTYPNLPLSTIVATLAALLYLVLPIDILSDFIPVLGWLDDAAVLGFVMLTEQNDVSEYLDWKSTQQLPATTKTEKLSD